MRKLLPRFDLQARLDQASTYAEWLAAAETSVQVFTPRTGRNNTQSCSARSASTRGLPRLPR